MTENKLYALCREEARKIIYDNIGVSNIKYDLAQLTAEIYGMKLLDMSQPDDTNDIWFMRTTNNNWTNSETYDDIGSTQDLHDHFVEQFNKEGK